jgi:hypothetical protein
LVDWLILLVWLPRFVKKLGWFDLFDLFSSLIGVFGFLVDSMVGFLGWLVGLLVGLVWFLKQNNNFFSTINICVYCRSDNSCNDTTMMRQADPRTPKKDIF